MNQVTDSWPPNGSSEATAYLPISWLVRLGFDRLAGTHDHKCSTKVVDRRPVKSFMENSNCGVLWWTIIVFCFCVINYNND